MRLESVLKGIGAVLFFSWAAGYPFLLRHIIGDTPLHLLAGGRQYLDFVDYLPLVGSALYGIGHIAEGRRGLHSDQAGNSS